MKPPIITAAYTSPHGHDHRPLPSFPTTPSLNDPADYVQRELGARWGSVMRSSSAIPHPYLAPGAIYDQLWTWDSYFMSLAVPDDRIDHATGSLITLLHAVRADGRAPNLVRPDGTASYDHVGQPMHAQWALHLAHRLEDGKWLQPLWPALLRTRQWHNERCRTRHGLYRWTDESGTGLDNDPAIYGRHGSTVGLVDVNCLHYRELRSMAHLAKKLGVPGSDDFESQAQSLRSAINQHMWDPLAQTYRHLDLSDHHRPTLQELTWETQLVGGTWGLLFPLWTGVADAEIARQLIEAHVLDSDRYLSPHGIRSMSADSPLYNNVSMVNPSNWQGPVWGLSTFVTCYGLARYGHRDEAIDVAGRLIRLMAADLEANDTVHEYYHAETGAPLSNPGFLGWNLLATRVLEDLREGRDPTGTETWP